MDALKAAAAKPQAAVDDDDDGGYSDDDFDASALQKPRKAQQVLRSPKRATSPIRTTASPRDSKVAEPRRSRARRSTQKLAKSSASATDKLLKTSLAAFMNKVAEDEGAGKKNKKRVDKSKLVKTFRKSRMNALASAKKVEKKKFARESDAKQCTFKPKISKASRDAVAGGGDPLKFIMNMEAKHRTRDRKLDRARKEKDYAAKVDKLYCPSCTAEQTYKEWAERIKRCERCNVLYRPRQAWGTVGDSFFSRLEEAEAKKKKGIQQLRSSIEKEKTTTRKRVLDKTTGKLRTVRLKPKSWKEVSGSFLKRMEDDAVKRKENQDQLNKTVSELDPECTFAPKITRRPKKR